MEKKTDLYITGYRGNKCSDVLAFGVSFVDDYRKLIEFN